MLFVYAMLTMSLTGAGIAALRGVEASVIGGLLAVYLVVTVLTTVRPAFSVREHPCDLYMEYSNRAIWQSVFGSERGILPIMQPLHAVFCRYPEIPLLVRMDCSDIILAQFSSRPLKGSETFIAKSTQPMGSRNPKISGVDEDSLK